MLFSKIVYNALLPKIQSMLDANSVAIKFKVQVLCAPHAQQETIYFHKEDSVLKLMDANL